MGEAEYAAWVPKLKGVRVLVVGDAMLDHYVVGAVDRISPEAPVPILSVEKEFDRVGGAANVAANVVSLGGHAEMVCLAGRDLSDGRDPDAERLRRRCEQRGFDPTLLRFLPCTIRKTRVVAGRQQMLRIDWEHHFGRSEEEVAAARNSGAPWEPLPLHEPASEARGAVVADLLAVTDVVLVSDYAKGMVDGALMDQLRDSGKPVIVDPRPVHAALYPKVTLITPNRKEGTAMIGEDPRHHLPPADLAARLCERLEANILLTLGGEGMFLRTLAGHEELIPTRAQEVFDVTGAGDTVAATMALGLGAGMELPEAAHLANAAAGVVVAHIGTAAVSPDELILSFGRTE